MALVNMKMDADEAKEWAQPDVKDAPEYPYGLVLDLDEKALAKLGITSLPEVGAQMTLQAAVVVTRTSAFNTQGEGQEKCVGLQITDMALGGAPAATDGDRAAKLYG